MSRKKLKKLNQMTLDLNLRTVFEGYAGSGPPPGPGDHAMKFNILDSGHGYNAFYVPLI